MFPEQKSKSSALVISRLILAAVILICFSMVLGMTGYLAMNKSAVNREAQVSITLEPSVISTPAIKDETKDWKTYTNNQYGYEVKYPKNWELIYLKDLYPGNISVALRSLKYQPIKDGNVMHEGEISINNIDNPKNLSIKDLYATFNDIGRFWFDKYEHKDITINGNPGVLFDNISEDSSSNIKTTSVDIQGDKKVIGISYLFLENPDKEVREIFDKMLSTFKFTEEDFSFSCGSTIIADIDNNIYRTVQIGSQCWLRENLRVIKNPKGKAITRYCYDNDPNICEIDGGLYDWNTAMNNSTAEGAQGICPSGWHVPKDSEWYVLERDLASGKCSSDRAYDANGEPWSEEENERIAWDCNPAGKEIKIDGSSGFMSILSGVGAFTAIYSSDSPDSIKTKLKFRDRELGVNFWSSTGTYDSAWIRSLDLNHSKVYRGSHYGGSFYSIRCLKD